jgi:hypothetical protein
MLHKVFGNNLLVFIEFGIYVLLYLIFFCGMDLIRKKKVTFGFNVFLGLWLAFSVEALSISIVLALVIFLLAIVFSVPIYFKFFSRPTKELP